MNASKAVSLGIYFGIGFAIANILGNCGGSDPKVSTTVPNSRTENIANPLYDYRDYAPFRNSVTRTFNHGTWTSTITADGTDVTWGADTEEFRVRGDWVFLDAYRTSPYYWRSVATRAEVDDGQGWVSLPLTGSTYYARVSFQSGFTLRQWGCINDSDDKCLRRWFHQHTITPKPSVYNSCWQGIGDSIRPVLRQQEVWWDSDGGFIRGTAAIGVNGEPDGSGVRYDFYQDIARDAGYVWQGTDLCLIR